MVIIVSLDRTELMPPDDPEKMIIMPNARGLAAYISAPDSPEAERYVAELLTAQKESYGFKGVTLAMVVEDTGYVKEARDMASTLASINALRAEPWAGAGTLYWRNGGPVAYFHEKDDAKRPPLTVYGRSEPELILHAQMLGIPDGEIETGHD